MLSSNMLLPNLIPLIDVTFSTPTSFIIHDPDNLSFRTRAPDLKSRTHLAHNNLAADRSFAPSKERSADRP